MKIPWRWVPFRGADLPRRAPKGRWERTEDDTPTRQFARRGLFLEAFREITRKHDWPLTIVGPKRSRKIRRSIARVVAKKRWQMVRAALKTA